MPRSTAKDLERREKTRRVQEEYPLPSGESIQEVDVLNTDAVLLEGLFDLEQLESIVRHMRALREP